MKKVAVVMGSASDMPVVQPAVDKFKEFGVECTVRILSAHRTPMQAMEFAKSAYDNDYGVIIAAAGKAAHLAGAMAANTVIPVIGIPVKASELDGLDALLATVQMPSGIPVATVAINGGANAGLLAAKILATSDPDLLLKLKKYSNDLKEQVQKKDAKLQEIGYKAYTEGMKK